MKNIPSLRRHPRPPALQTTALNQPDSDTHMANTTPIRSAGTEAVIRQFQASHASGDQTPRYTPRDVDTPITGRRSSPSPFRGFISRARKQRSPASANPAGDTPSSALRDMEMHEASGSASAAPQELPEFLKQDRQLIDSKFESLMWAERARISAAERNRDIPDYRWGSYQAPPLPDGTPRPKATQGLDRYFNIKPWNYNRVRLKVPDGQIDYVNASHIILPPLLADRGDDARYIAMQGPTATSFPYVWRMVAEQTQSPAVIVQLTNFQESGMVKCDQYFPQDTFDEEEGNPTTEVNPNDIWQDGWSATVTYEKDSPDNVLNGTIQKRRILLHVKGEDEPRLIWHLLYTTWPDFGTPDADDLEAFHQLAGLADECNNSENPKIVHCSAGVGRTGTFITLEYLIRALYDNTLAEWLQQPGDPGRDLVNEVVGNLRKLRKTMVQSEAQYRFLYASLRKLWCQKYGGEDE